MIEDKETNLLYLADSLPKQQPAFFQQFEKVLHDCKVKFQLLPNTKDIWAVDYMPIQISKDKFVQFTYRPDYLVKDKELIKTISDVDSICKEMDLKPVKSNILLDGGNVVKSTDKVIMCDKVFRENPATNEKDLIKNLKEIFEIEKLIFIPADPQDCYGHADGIVRFLDNDRVLINRYSTDKRKEKTDFALRLHMSLYNAGVDYTEIPFNPYNNDNDDQANGIYINYLQMKGLVVVPTFGMSEDDLVVKQFEQLFSGQTIVTIDSREIAKEGGVLNCITWNIEVSNNYN
ncbi:MAG: agmatine deiminase family protein [Bacteroidetes bacterium]|nr:agmatine deiminase family protein [Bacteroidota bacterium]